MENQMITVTLFGEDSSFDNRRRFRDAVSSALEQAQLGTYIGGGSMITDEPHYNVEYEVTDESQGLVLIFTTLRSMSVDSSTEVSVGADRRYNVYDDTSTDLGPLKRTLPVIRGNPSASPQALMADLQQIADDLKKKYGGPKDPNRGA